MRFSLLLAVTVSLCFAGRASADTYLYSVYSLEWLTDSSSLVVVATVKHDGNTGAKNAKVQIKEVERALKGTVDKKLPEIANVSKVLTAGGENRAILFLRPSADPKVLEVTYVVYLNKHKVPAKDRAAYFAGLIPQYHDSSAEPMNFNSALCVAVDKNGTVLSTPDAVIKLVEARAKAHPKRTIDGFYNYLGDDQLLNSDVIYRVLAPFDPEFKKDFLKHLENKNGWTRYHAIPNLTRFKDAESITALKKLLADDFVAEVRVDPERSDSPRKQFYVVRKAAYEALRAWDVDVKKPELEPPPVTEKKPQ